MGPTGTAGRNTRVSNPARDATGVGGQPPEPPGRTLIHTKIRGRGDSPSDLSRSKGKDFDAGRTLMSSRPI